LVLSHDYARDSLGATSWSLVELSLTKRGRTVLAALLMEQDE
jgi:hypothetical protein